jgi:hypothetical protein
LLNGLISKTQGLKYGFFMIGGLYAFAAYAATRSTRNLQPVRAD